MWGQQPYYGWQWGGMAQQNPTPQSTDPGEWAAKAVQWAQQRQIQEQYYNQVAVQTQQQQQQQLQLQQLQQLQQQHQQLQQQQQQQQQQLLQQQHQQQIPAVQAGVYGNTQMPEQQLMGGVEGGGGGGGGGVVMPQGGIQREQYLQGSEEATQATFVQQSEQRVTPQPPPKPLFEVPPAQLGGGAVPSHASHGFDARQEQEDSGYEDPSYQPSYEEQSHLGVGSGQGEGEEGFHQGEVPQEGHFFQQRGHYGSSSHRGDFQQQMFRSPRGRGVAPQRFPFRGPRHFGSHGERGPSPRQWERGGMGFQGRRGPTEETFGKGGPRGDMYEEQEEEEHSFSRKFPPGPSERDPQHEGYLHKLETAKKREQQKELELRRELERMREIERRGKMEIEQKLERERKAEMERLKELELKRREEERMVRAREQELEKKREMDLQLTQEIENKKREMERMRERQEQMERELLEKKEELERRSTGGGGGGSGVGEAWNHPPDDMYAGQAERAEQATIPSWNTDPARIPGLGDLAEPAVEPQGSGQAPKPQLATPTSQPQDPSGGGVPATQMMESLGKIVSQLQTLQGLTSSLKLIRTLPKGKEGDAGSGGQGVPGEKTEGQGGGPDEVEMEAQREKELSEDTKRKVAALLANESDSDGEQTLQEKPKQTSVEAESSSIPAREFDGTYSIQPQVYSTYPSDTDQYGEPHNNAPHSRGYREDYERGGGGVGGSDGGGGGEMRRPKYEYDTREDDREIRPPYAYPPPHTEGERDLEYRYPRPPPPDTRRSPPPQGGYGYPTPKEYSHSPYPGPPRDVKEEERGRGHSPPRLEGRDYPYGHAPYGGPDRPPPPHMRERPPPIGREHPPGPPIHPSDYRGPPPSDDRHYHPPPRDPKRSGGIFSQMESIDYSHGSAGGMNVKSVDYHHGAPSYQPPMPRNFPPGPGVPYGPEGYPPYGEGMPPSAFMQFGGPGGYLSPGGLDPAAIFAAYQGGESKRRTLPLWLREELEKLERKKQKEMEKLKREGPHREREGQPRWRDEVEEEEGDRRERRGKWEEEEEEERHSRSRVRSYRHPTHSRSPSHSEEESPPQRKRKHYEPEETEEDKQLNLVMKIRNMLTEVLLDVTNQEIEAVATEMIEEARKPKLVIQMKGVAKMPSKDNILGLNIYSSGSESDSNDDPGGRRERGKEGKRSKGSSKKRNSADSSRTPPPVKLPKPEEIAAAFKDSKESGKKGAGFVPMPRVVQEKQRQGGKTASSSKHPEGPKEEKEKEKSGKKSKEKKELVVRRSSDEPTREKEKERGKEKERKKHSDKDRESERDRDNSSSHRKSSSSKKEHSKEKEKGRDRSKNSKRSLSPVARASKSRRHSSPLSPRSSGVSSVKSRLGRRSRSRSPMRSPVRSPPARPKFPRMASPPGKGSIRVTKMMPPILSPSEKWSDHSSMPKWH